jgi:hypothetical protein
VAHASIALLRRRAAFDDLSRLAVTVPSDDTHLIWRRKPSKEAPKFADADRE